VSFALVRAHEPHEPESRSEAVPELA
jgi:hypothetical protein